MKQDYHSSITAQISAEEAFKNINDVRAWWTENIEGSTNKLNDVFFVDFGETHVTFKITDVIPNKKIIWYVQDCNLHWLNNKKEWKDTSVIWEISSQNNSTQINMTHIGLTPEVECYENCKAGWNQYIQGSLFKLITNHKGNPIKKKETLTH